MKKIFFLCIVSGLLLIAFFYFGRPLMGPSIQGPGIQPQADTSNVVSSQKENGSEVDSPSMESSQLEQDLHTNLEPTTPVQPDPLMQNSTSKSELSEGSSNQSAAVDADLYFSVQTGSFQRRQNAVREYKRLAGILAPEALKTLRIERIGPYHAVRFGKSATLTRARNLLDTVKERRPSAIILQAYIIQSRIILSYPDMIPKPEPIPAQAEPSPQPKINQDEPPVPATESKEDRNSTLILQKTPTSQGETATGTPSAQQIQPIQPDQKTATPSLPKPLANIQPREEQSLISQGEQASSEIVEENLQDKQTQETKAEIPEIGVEPIIALTKDDQGKELRMPTAVFYDTKNTELYVINGSANRIVIFGSDYFPENSLGEGRGVYAPTSGTIGPNGSIYICQMNRGEKKPRISIYNAAFFPANEIEIDFADENLKDFSPDKVAVDPQGRIYVIGLNSQALLILEPNEKQHKLLFFYADRKGNFLGFSPPADENIAPVFLRDIFIDSQGHIFVLSEQAGKIYTLNANHEFLFNFGTKGGSAGKLSRPKALTVDEKDHRVYVVDYMRHTIVVYDLKGNFRYEIGGRGTGLGWFNYPVDIEIGNQGQLIVADYFNHRVQALKVTFRETFPPPPPEIWQTGTSG